MHIGGDEVAHRDWDGAEKSYWQNSPLCEKFLAENSVIPDATWQKLQPTDYADLQAYFTKRFVAILAENSFSPAAWEEPWSYGVPCLAGNVPGRDKADCVRPKSDFTDDESLNIYAYNWNIDLEFAQTDWPYQLANNGYKV